MNHLVLNPYGIHHLWNLTGVGVKITTLDHNLSSVSEAICLLLLSYIGSFGKPTLSHK